MLGPFTALYRYFLKRCTLTNKAVGTIWLFSKPPQRRQGPDTRPLWLYFIKWIYVYMYIHLFTDCLLPRNNSSPFLREQPSFTGIGSKAVYACPEGYTDVGDPRTVCLPNGTWSAKRLSCEIGEPYSVFCTLLHDELFEFQMLTFSFKRR